MLIYKEVDRSYFKLYDRVSMNVDVRSEYQVVRFDGVFRNMEENIKENQKKSGNMGFMSFRDRSVYILERINESFIKHCEKQHLYVATCSEKQ